MYDVFDRHILIVFPHAVLYFYCDDKNVFIVFKIICIPFQLRISRRFPILANSSGLGSSRRSKKMRKMPENADAKADESRFFPTRTTSTVRVQYCTSVLHVYIPRFPPQKIAHMTGSCDRKIELVQYRSVFIGYTCTPLTCSTGGLLW